MKLRKIIPICLVASMTLLYGCQKEPAQSGQKGSNEQNEQKESSEQKVATEKESIAGSDVPDYLNATGFPIVKNPIKLRVFVSQSSGQPEFQDIYLLKKYDEMTGIQIEWINVPKDVRSEKISLAMTSTDMPDAFLKCSISAVDQLKYGEDGAIANLNKDDLLKKYAPNFWAYMEKYPDVKQSQTQPNGAIYSIPAAADSPATRINRKLFYNKKWLDKLELKQPTTTDEFYEMLKAFKTRDPNGNGQEDEVPLAQTSDNIWQSFAGAFGLMNRGVHDAYYDMDEATGKIRHTVTSEAFRDELTFLNKLYSEGLIDQEFLTYKDGVAAGYVSQDRLGVYINTNLALLSADVAEATFAPCEQALKGPNGNQLWSSIRSHLHSTGAFLVSADCKYPEAALRWADYFYSDEGVLFYHYGIEGDTCTKNTDGSYSYTDKVLAKMKEGSSYDLSIASYTAFGGGNNPSIMKYPYFSGQELDPIPMKAADNLNNYSPKEVWPFFTYTVEENSVMTDVGGQINKFCKQKIAEFITGQTALDDKSWNAYVSEVKGMGLDKVLDVKEAAYKRIK